MYSTNSNSEDVVNFIRRRKSNLKSVFHSKCCLCGFSEVQEALEFHHVNPNTKNFAIMGSDNQTKALQAQLEEMKKCILVCANCHRGIHYNVYSIPENWQDFYDIQIAQKLLDDLNKIKHNEIKYCQTCGKQISKGATYCVQCAALNQRKVIRPSREELKSLIRTQPFTLISKKYGVTDNAIKKWCDAENLPRKKVDINKYSDEEWKKI